MLRGRPAAKRSIGVARELVASDVRNLERAELPAFQTFRDSYHVVARLLAAGCNDQEVAIGSGYSVGNIQRIKHDPAMRAAVEAYRSSTDEKYKGVIDETNGYLIANRNLALRRLNDKLVNDEEHIPVKELLAISADNLDRTGYGKVVTKKVQVDLADRLAQALAASKQVDASRMKVIDHE
jgi:hypothetical protein